MAALTCNEINFDSEVLQADVPVLVDFWAPWCGPCRAISPIIDAIADAFPGQLKVVKVNVDDAPRVAARFGTVSIPNIMLFKDGKVRVALVGLRSRQSLLDALKPHLN